MKKLTSAIGWTFALDVAALIFVDTMKSPPYAFTLPCWLIMIAWIVWTFSTASFNNPYKSAFAILGAPLLFWAPSFLPSLILPLEKPTGLFEFIGQRPVLVLLVIYFAAASRFAMKGDEVPHATDYSEW